MTEKLYYKDAYVKEFYATVMSCKVSGELYEITLDKTAFFPEEGGQYSDTGMIADARLLSAYEKEGVIYHVTDKPLEVGASVFCKLNFDERFEKMQIHTAEHIISGLFHSLYGLENVGFHLGAEEVTMDLNAVVSEEMIVRVEELANRAVYENVAVSTYFPDREELPSLKYRSKLELSENVRIVKIGEYDSCACCAPHVKATGEVGIIRILDFMKHRGGTRLTITAGARAVRGAREGYELIRKCSGLLSVPKADIANGVERLLMEISELKEQIKSERREFYLKEAKSVERTSGNLVLYYEKAGFEELRLLANELVSRVSGILVLLSGTDFDLKYLIVSESVDLSGERGKINEALSGKGGGKPDALQGSFKSSVADVKKYFG